VGYGARSRHAQSACFQGFLCDLAHLVDVLWSGGFVAGSSFAHDIAPDSAMCNLSSDIHGISLGSQAVQVFGEALPLPVDAFCQSSSGNVLNSFHQLNQPLLRTWAYRGKTHAAVAHDYGGHTVGS